ncbi:hypothetical protein Droror1_Dr00017004, partial [Drosera rotundifolia]
CSIIFLDGEVSIVEGVDNANTPLVFDNANTAGVWVNGRLYIIKQIGEGYRLMQDTSNESHEYLSWERYMRCWHWFTMIVCRMWFHFMTNALLYSLKMLLICLLKLLQGFKRGRGIICGYCDQEISPSQFEAHAGCGDRRQPYHHLYTNNGTTLHDIAMSLQSGQELSTGQKRRYVQSAGSRKGSCLSAMDVLGWNVSAL